MLSCAIGRVLNSTNSGENVPEDNIICFKKVNTYSKVQHIDFFFNPNSEGAFSFFSEAEANYLQLDFLNSKISD